MPVLALHRGNARATAEAEGKASASCGITSRMLMALPFLAGPTSCGGTGVVGGGCEGSRVSRSASARRPPMLSGF